MACQRTFFSRGFTLIELIIVLSIICVLLTVAIPAYRNRVRRTKTSEAVLNLRRLYDASVSYHEVEHASITGAVLPRQFPEPQGDTPAANSCCAQASQRCAPVPEVWSRPTWQALGFGISEPHYYWYRYETSGSGASAMFEAVATGNLDCDSIYSKYIRRGQVDAQGMVVGGGGIQATDPGE